MSRQVINYKRNFWQLLCSIIVKIKSCIFFDVRVRSTWLYFTFERCPWPRICLRPTHGTKKNPKKIRVVVVRPVPIGNLCDRDVRTSLCRYTTQWSRLRSANSTDFIIGITRVYKQDVRIRTSSYTIVLLENIYLTYTRMNATSDLGGVTILRTNVFRIFLFRANHFSKNHAPWFEFEWSVVVAHECKHRRAKPTTVFLP